MRFEKLGGTSLTIGKGVENTTPFRQAHALPDGQDVPPFMTNDRVGWLHSAILRYSIRNPAASVMRLKDDRLVV
jgi:hypothetical protein